MSERAYLIRKAERSYGEASQSGSRGIIDNKAWDKSAEKSIRFATGTGAVSGGVLGGMTGAGLASGGKKMALRGGIGGAAGAAATSAWARRNAKKMQRDPVVRRRVEDAVLARAAQKFRDAGMKVEVNR